MAAHNNQFYDVPVGGQLVSELPALYSYCPIYSVRVGGNPGLYLSPAMAKREVNRVRHNCSQAFGDIRVAAAHCWGTGWEGNEMYYINTSGVDPPADLQLELLTPAGYASGTSIEDECRRAAALGDLITQPHAVPSENFYRRHSLPVHHSSPAFTPIEPTPVATPRVPARVPAGPSHIDSSASTTAYTEVIEDLSEHMNAVQIAGDGRILTVPYARKTLTIDGAKICKSTKYVSSAGIQMLDTLRYDDNAIAVINHIYLGSSVDRDEANPISFICELWRAGWSDGEDKASALFKTMKPIRGVSGSSAQV